MKDKKGITPNKLILLMILCAVIIAIILGGLSGCCRQISSTRSESDSTRVEIRTIEKEILRDTTIYISIPQERDMAITVDSSYLSTSVAESWASIDAMGLLHHGLQNRPFEIGNTIQYVDRLRIDSVDKVRIVEKEKIVVQQKRVIIWWPILSLSAICAILTLILWLKR